MGVSLKHSAFLFLLVVGLHSFLGPLWVVAEEWAVSERLVEYTGYVEKMKEQEIWPFKKHAEFVDFLEDAELPPALKDEIKKNYKVVSKEVLPEFFFEDYGLKENEVYGVVIPDQAVQKRMSYYSNAYLKDYQREHFPKLGKPRLIKAVDVKIKINSAEVKEIAQKFSTIQPAQEVESILQKNLGGGKEAWVPLERLLPTIVQNKVGQFADCHGPNCINAALNASLNQNKIKYTDSYEFNQAIQKHFDLLPKTENLQIGDLVWIHRNSAWKSAPVHASTYVGNGIVFTKNGFSKSAPYIFQTLPENLEVFKSSFNQYEVYRPKYAKFKKLSDEKCFNEVVKALIGYGNQ